MIKRNQPTRSLEFLGFEKSKPVTGSTGFSFRIQPGQTVSDLGQKSLLAKQYKEKKHSTTSLSELPKFRIKTESSSASAVDFGPFAKISFK